MEQVRKNKSLRGDGKFDSISRHKIERAIPSNPAELLALREAFKTVAESHPRKAKLVELRFFIGLSNREAAAALDIYTSTAEQDWRYARAWLKVHSGYSSSDMSRN